MEAGTLPRVGSASLPTLTPRLLRLASDARLVGLVRERRDGAFEAIYDRHHRGILSFCRHMLGDADEAEDAVQHTFMAAYSDLIASEKPIHLRAWLFTIARNRCYTILRGRREQPSAEIEEAQTEGLASQVQRREDLRELVDDMRRLPDEQRAALVLAELDSLSHSDIADVLGVPREKVKALVFQARESLLASRTARDTACTEIREQLACGRGATLRRANLRRHLRDCEGCRAYRAQVDRQRKQLAALLPVVPGIALKQAVLGGGGATAGVAAIGGGVIASSALKGGVLKGIAAVVIASLSTAGTIVVAAGNIHVSSLLKAASHPLAAAGFVPAHSAHHRAAAASSSTAPAAISFSGGLPNHAHLAGPVERHGVGTRSALGLAHRSAGAPGAARAREHGATRARVKLPAPHRRGAVATPRQIVRLAPVATAPVTRHSAPVTAAPRTPSVTTTPAPATSAASPAKSTASPAKSTASPAKSTATAPTQPTTGSTSPGSGGSTGSQPTHQAPSVVRAPTNGPTSVRPGTPVIGSSNPSGGVGSRYRAGAGGPTSDGSTGSSGSTATGTTRGSSTSSTPTAGSVSSDSSSTTTTTTTTTSTTPAATTTTTTSTTPAATTPTAATTTTTTTPSTTTTTSSSSSSPTTGDIGSSPGSSGAPGSSSGPVSSTPGS
jgi:RNA polymerase sigma factor (sigma-70 family)